MDGIYRVYCVDEGNRVVRVHSVSAATDDEAMGAARDIDLSEVREVWLGDRLVGSIKVRVAVPSDEVSDSNLNANLAVTCPE